METASQGLASPTIWSEKVPKGGGSQPHDHAAKQVPLHCSSNTHKNHLSVTDSLNLALLLVRPGLEVHIFKMKRSPSFFNTWGKTNSTLVWRAYSLRCHHPSASSSPASPKQPGQPGQRWCWPHLDEAQGDAHSKHRCDLRRENCISWRTQASAHTTNSEALPCCLQAVCEAAFQSTYSGCPTKAILFLCSLVQKASFELARFQSSPILIAARDKCIMMQGINNLRQQFWI